MGLQVRLRHALGERLFDLPDRPLENPLIIGRAGAADIKIPSVTVSNQHGALFVHEGQWYVQDTSGGHATWVNGSALEGPTPLCVGDKIVFGTDARPATIEVDPAGVAEGRTGQPIASSEPAPAAVSHATVAGPAPRQATRPSPPPPPARRPMAAPAPVQPQVSAAADPWGNEGGDAIAGWDQPANQAAGSESPAPVRRKKPPQQMSQAGMFVGITVCIAIVGGTLWVARILWDKQHEPVAAVEKPTGPKVVWGKADNALFSEHQEGEVASGGNSTANPAPPAETPSTPTPTDTPRAAPADSTADSPPKVEDKAWDELEGLANQMDVGHGILKYEDYRREHPGKHTEELDNLETASMDGLWWKRIADLCTKRDKLTKDVAAKAKDIKEQPAGAFQETLKKEKAVVDADLANAVKSLTMEMGYTSDSAPEPDNKDMISKLTAERDQGKFNDWKSSTMKFILRNHGSLPWEG